MRIAFFDDRHHLVYGAQENLLSLAESCALHGHEVSVVTTSEGAFARSARRRGLVTFVLETPAQLQRFDGELAEPTKAIRAVPALFRSNIQMRQLLQQLGIAIVVTSGVRSSGYTLLATASRRIRLVMWAQIDTPLGAPAGLAGIAAWRIGIITPEAVRTFPNWAARFIDRKLRSLPPGRSSDNCGAQPVDRQEGAPIRILTVTSITPRKGIDALIHAVASLPQEHRLTVVGGTTGAQSERHLEQLEQLAAHYSLDVNFVGWQDDVAPFLADADIFVLASRNEGLPGVLLEAMAAGLPCVTTRAGGAGVLVERSGAGVAVDVADIGELGRSIQRLVENPEARATHAASGHRYVQTHHHQHASYNALMHILAELPN